MVKLVVDNVNDPAGFVNAVIFNCEQQEIKDREMKRRGEMCSVVLPNGINGLRHGSLVNSISFD